MVVKIMSDILLLSGHDIDVLQSAKINADIQNVYKAGFLYKIFKRSKYTLPICFENWKNHIKSFKTIIVFDTYYNDGLTDYIYRKNNDIRLIFYCWNTISDISKRINIDKVFKDKRIEIWSYNRLDCQKYHMKYNPQFWNKMLIPSRSLENKYDIVFIGSPKNRMDELQFVYKKCGSENLRTYFYLTGCKCEFNKNINNEFLPYKNYVSEIANNSNIILDLVSNENYGLTLRPLEAIFLRKKIITNYFDIVHEPFYDVSNVFLLGKDDRSFSEFLNTPYREIDSKVIDYYDCVEWIKRFERL